MTWLAWRQFRVPLVSMYASLAVITAVLLLLGRSEEELLYRGGQFALYLLPAAIGAFWGVPLITRELEAGTHNLAWNQTVSRARWLAVKLGLGVVAAMVAAGLLSAVVGWWVAPIDAAAVADPHSAFEPRIEAAMFTARGIAPIGYAAFAFVLGVAAGLVLRRTVAAIAVTLLVFAAVQVAVPLAVRPHLLPSTEQVVALTAVNIEGVQVDERDVPAVLRVVRPAGAWVLADETVNPQGQVVSALPEVVHGCLPPAQPGVVPDFERVHGCFAQLSGLGYEQHLTYQPASRFWPLQWLETGLFLMMSGLLAWFCFRRLRHVS
ncbi:transporter [Amycolatopsis sp. 195334CR]|uniref:transporter n=1 Tax=Amycolatopsis sp. 195334CR TaxID=2814588 RepID=UPI001A907B0C|nr:transporter [Amycolatopsis sp. 195334CR]MBN6039956.1 transporter [Amycolatopsis sp. 195334CR]